MAEVQKPCLICFSQTLGKSSPDGLLYFLSADNAKQVYFHWTKLTYLFGHTFWFSFSWELCLPDGASWNQNEREKWKQQDCMHCQFPGKLQTWRILSTCLLNCDIWVWWIINTSDCHTIISYFLLHRIFALEKLLYFSDFDSDFSCKSFLNLFTTEALISPGQSRMSEEFYFEWEKISIEVGEQRTQNWGTFCSQTHKLA